jgi:SAM-dependent methyltransferase
MTSMDAAAGAGGREDLLRRHLREVPPHRALLRSVEAELMSGVPLQPPVLDVGCGDGHFASMAYDQVLDVGSDLPHVTLPSGDLREAHARGVYRVVIAASATALPFADARFRTVVSNSVLEHIPDLDAALAEIARVLAPDGTLGFTVPSEYFGEFLFGTSALTRLNARRLGAAYARWFDRISLVQHRPGPQVWERKLNAVGLEVEHWRYYFSKASHQVFDLSHYLGAPTLLYRRLTGRWVPSARLARSLESWLRPYASAAAQPSGAYLFFVCRKSV